MSALIDQGVDLDRACDQSCGGFKSIRHYACYPESKATLLPSVRSIIRRDADLSFSCEHTNGPAWIGLASLNMNDEEALEAFRTNLSAWSEKNDDKRLLHEVAIIAFQSPQPDLIIRMLMDAGMKLSGPQSYYCRIVLGPGSRATNDISVEREDCFSAFVATVKRSHDPQIFTLFKQMIDEWGADVNTVMNSGSCATPLGVATTYEGSASEGLELVRNQLVEAGAVDGCKTASRNPKHVLWGSWTYNQGVCTFFVDWRIVCDVDGQRADWTWAVVTPDEIEWTRAQEDADPRSVRYRLKDVYSSQVTLQPLGQNTSNSSIVLSRVERPTDHY